MARSRGFSDQGGISFAVLAGLAWLILTSPARADYIGTLYFTTSTGGTNVNKVGYDYNPGVSFTLTPVTGIASTPGADGLVFTSDNYLAVGGAGPAVYKVNPITGAYTTISTGGPNAYEMMASPNGTIFSSGAEGGNPTPVSYPSNLGSSGTPHPVTGDDSGVTHIAWSDPTHAFYTIASGDNGFGNFGTIDPTTFVTSRKITGLPAAHGMIYDPYTGDLILFGDSTISQIDPNNPTVVLSSLSLPLGDNFDQGGVDSAGHIFVANNGGDMAFIDISQSKLVGSPDFVATPFVATGLDDIAPLVGPGSDPPLSTPEPASVAFVTIAGAALLGYGYRRRRSRVSASQSCPQPGHAPQ